MVVSAPTNYSLSPSQATTHLTINHDVADDIDSSNAFEGPEKLLEVWFAPSPAEIPSCAHPNGLKAVSSSTWVSMLDMVNCKILSVLESDAVDAYLLSESSMFVWPHKLILKTCGTTTLLLGLRRLLHIAAANAGFPFHNAQSLGEVKSAATPHRVFYSRKNFLFPDRQRGPHRSWKQEVKYLDDMFNGGSAYMVGKMNGDHWYLYITPGTLLSTSSQQIEANLVAQAATHLGVSAKIPTGSSGSGAEPQHDETLEILMTDLDPEHAKQFYFSDDMAHDLKLSACRSDDQDVFSNEENKLDEPVPSEGHMMGTLVSRSSGLSSIFPTSVYPDARIDSYLFTPCGYSANGLVPPPSVAGSSPAPSRSQGQYWTVHVTPEPNCSFASFETNVPPEGGGPSTAEIIERVISIFRPGRFSVTLFNAKVDNESSKVVGTAQRLNPVKGYKRIDGIVHDFEDYDLVFRFYEREGWTGGDGTRVGEI